MSFWWEERRGNGIMELDDRWEWWVQWSDKEAHLVWKAWLFPVFHHHHSIQPHVDTGWRTQDTQPHRWSIGIPSCHSQGSHRWLAKWVSEVVQQWCGRTRNLRKWLCLQWMDRIPYRDVPTSHIRGLQTPNTFDPWTISCQSQYRWQQVIAAMSYSGKWMRTQNHCKS